ncbi:hypothetical protein N7453_001906 [Penicillium expansum]|nr:hypothetical protein N7453_001906 [Penicillium expansum]
MTTLWDFHALSTPPTFRSRRGLPEKRKIRDVKKVVAVSSAKGGVGKSTLAVNLALSFARRGIKTGILDTDIFGPSIPTLLNLSGEPRLDENNCLVPLTNYGLKSMSMGYLLPQTQADSTTGELPMDTTPISWRGLMVTKAMHQLLHSVSWGPLDVLILDLPPGTGDVQLTINQEVIIDGAVIVSTPKTSHSATLYAELGCSSEWKFPCSECHHHAHGENHGVVAECKRLGVDFLGDIPLDARVCEDADRGMPTVVAEESAERSARRDAFLSVAEQVARKIGLNWH